MKKQGRPPKAENEKLRGCRYNLNLDRDLKEPLEYVAWKKRTSITQYLNDLIRADIEKEHQAGLGEIKTIIDNYDISAAILEICEQKKICLNQSELDSIVNFILRKRG